MQRSNSITAPPGMFPVAVRNAEQEDLEILDPPLRMGDGETAYSVKTGGRIRDSNPPEFEAELIGGFGERGEMRWKATVLHINVGVTMQNLWQVKDLLEKIMHETLKVSHIKHPHLHNLHYSFLIRLSASGAKPDAWRLIQILDSKSRMLPLLDVLRISGPLQVSLTMEYVKQICLALRALHNAKYAHRSLRLAHVLIEGEKKKVKVTNAYWFWSLLQLHANHKNLDLETLEEDNLNAGSEWFDCLQTGKKERNSNGWKEKDIFDLGICLAQMLFGLDIIKQFKTPSAFLRSIEYEDALDTSVLELLRALLSSQEPGGKKLTISKVLEMVDFAIEQLDASSSNLSPSTSDLTHSNLHKRQSLLKSPRSAHPDLPRELNASNQRGPFWQPHQQTPAQPSQNLRTTSRYLEDFEEVSEKRLGKGAFGEVVKARNKLDGNLYAIKKVKLPHDESSQIKVLREVTAKWPRMNHIYIVRYHASWVETVITTIAPKGKVITSSGIGLSSESMSMLGRGREDEEPTSAEKKEDTTTRTLSVSLPSVRNFPDEDFLNFDDPAIEEQPLDLSFIQFRNEDDSSQVDSGRGSDTSESTADLSTEEGEETAEEESEDGSRKTGRKLNRKNKSSKGILAVGHSSNRDAHQPMLTKFLYIQMELIENITLRDAIDEGKLTAQPERAWKFFRQMLMAMENFMSINIIHRDLKPANILVDKEDNIKIGDFGLAIDADDEFDGGEGYDPNNSEMTGNVGTTFYIAPEVRNASKRKGQKAAKGYTNKADMYSLGIIFFEMFHPFATGMERTQVLGGLGKEKLLLPDSWTSTVSKQQTDILKRCLDHDPVKRASPTELLNSDLLPPLADDELIVKAVREIGLPKSTYAKTLLGALFDSRSEQSQKVEFTYDYQPKAPNARKDPEGRETELMMTYGDNLKIALRAIFKKRGAVELNTHPLMPYRPNYDMSGPVRLLDEDSNSLMLAPDMVYPFCRMVAREEKRNRFKRWSIAPVFRNKYGVIEQPRWPLAASYDLVSETKTAAAEAECISVVDDVLDCVSFPEETVHLLNHYDILHCIIGSFRDNAKDIVLSSLQGQKYLSIENVVNELRVNNIPQNDINYLLTFNFYDDLEPVQEHILALFPSFQLALKKAFDELREIVQYCSMLCKRPVKICPLLPYSKYMHKGAVFQTVLPTRQISLAVGGRYDWLVQNLVQTGTKLNTTVVGVSLAFSRLAAALEERPSIDSSLIQQAVGAVNWLPSRCDVYIVSLQEGLFEHRLELLRDLWDNDISADIMYDRKSNLLEVTEICKTEGVRFLAILKEKQLKVTYKIKDVITEAEEEVPRENIPTWLRERLAELRGSTQIQPIVHRPDTPVETYVPEVQVIMPPDQRPNGSKTPKHRQRPSHADKQKQAVFSERATEVVKKASAAFNQQAPVFAIDVDPQTFWNIMSTPGWIRHDQDFKKVTTGSVLRQYLSEIRDEIKGISQSGTKWCWLFNSRDNKVAIQSLEV
ncbi:kinase-like protein [Atractiella rhizophila]|nr:kinase-like protein [Atractiella rhizophila]